MRRGIPESIFSGSMPFDKRPHSPGQFDTVILSPGSFGTKDHLQANGTLQTDIIFYPFGQVWAYDNWDELQFFGGMENWDWTNGLGYTPSRTYRANHGRWLSPDPLAGDISNPQSLNRYAYALNNPESLNDPLGLDSCPEDGVTIDDPTCGGMGGVSGGGGGGPPIPGGNPGGDPEYFNYLMTNDASCQNPAGAWNDGTPIYPPGAGGGGTLPLGANTSAPTPISGWPSSPGVGSGIPGHYKRFPTS